jgi:hypothetical protein
MGRPASVLPLILAFASAAVFAAEAKESPAHWRVD